MSEKLNQTVITEEAPKKNKTWLIILIIAIVLLVLIIFIGYYI